MQLVTGASICFAIVQGSGSQMARAVADLVLVRGDFTSMPPLVAEGRHLHDLAQGRAQLVEETGMLSFPQIVVGEVLVGGFQQLVQADQTGRLAELTAQAA